LQNLRISGGEGTQEYRARLSIDRVLRARDFWGERLKVLSKKGEKRSELNAIGKGNDGPSFSVERLGYVRDRLGVFRKQKCATERSLSEETSREVCPQKKRKAGEKRVLDS